MKGLVDRPDDAAERAGRKPDGKALRMAALQRAISQADANARTAALFATLEADAKKASSQERSAALADLARMRSCAGSLASAWLTAQPGAAEVTAVEFCISAHLRLREDLCAGQDADDACVCGRSMAAGGTHSLMCSALWHTVLDRHNALTEAWLRTKRVAGVMRLLGCPSDGAWCLVCELCVLVVVCVDFRCSLSLVFLGGARCIELASCNTHACIDLRSGLGCSLIVKSCVFYEGLSRWSLGWFRWVCTASCGYPLLG